MYPFQQPGIVEYSKLLATSFEHWVKRPLLQDADIDSPEFAEALYYAPFVLVSHGTEDDPIFRYVNHAAQLLWKTDFAAMTRMPSRLSARPDAQADRERLLKEAREKGFVNNYHGVRVTSDGQLFEISDTILWNVYDKSGMRHGQAAMFTDFMWMDR